MPLAQGMWDKCSIEILAVHTFSFKHDGEYLCSYYADLNHPGRRISVTSKSVPAGFWPRILKRAGSKCFRACYGDQEDKESKRVNALYFSLQNCPA